MEVIFLGAVISPVVALCLQATWFSFEGNTMDFFNLMAQVNKCQHHEVPNPTPKLKGRRELKRSLLEDLPWKCGQHPLVLVQEG